jgi:hypothetical protein
MIGLRKVWALGHMALEHAAAYLRAMEDDDRNFGETMRLIFEGDADPRWANAATSLLAALRRGESEIALRHQAGDIQNRLTGRIIDADCRRVVELAREVAAG